VNKTSDDQRLADEIWREVTTREAGADDHPYGSWVGGSKSGGGRPGGGGGGEAEGKNLDSLVGKDGKLVGKGLPSRGEAPRELPRDFSTERIRANARMRAERDRQSGLVSSEKPKVGTFQKAPDEAYGKNVVINAQSPGGEGFHAKLLGSHGDKFVVEQHGNVFYVSPTLFGPQSPAHRANPAFKDLSSKDLVTRQKAEFKLAAAGRKDTWVAGGGGTETPFTRAGGKQRLQRVYNPATGQHGYLDLGQDRVFTDAELKKAGKEYP
jgi:hypothetical protein